MNTTEIVNRKTPQFITQEEMEYVVKQYIKEKKKRDIDINVLKNLNKNDPFFAVFFKDQLKKLDDAFLVASKYFISLDEY